MFVAILFNKLDGTEFKNDQIVIVRTAIGADNPYSWDFKWSGVQRRTTDMKEVYKLALDLARVHNCKVYELVHQDWDEVTIEWLESKLQEL